MKPFIRVMYKKSNDEDDHGNNSMKEKKGFLMPEHPF